MSEENDDKPFEPSQQKLDKARENGDIPRSPEVNVAAMYLGAWLALGFGGIYFVKQWLSMAERAVGAEGWTPGNTFDAAKSLSQYAGWAVIGVATIPSCVILLVLVLQKGLVFAPNKLAPDIKKINPFTNAKQKFGMSGLVTFGISLGKAALVCTGGWFLFRNLLGRIASSSMGGGRWVADLGVLMGRVLLLALAISVVIGGLEMGWKWFEHRKKNRMTRKEMED